MYFRYLTSGQFFINGYLKTQGFPKSTFFDPTKPVDSISTFANYAAKKYLDVKFQSREYVQPAVEYVQVRIQGTIKSVLNNFKSSITVNNDSKIFQTFETWVLLLQILKAFGLS